MGEIKLAGNNFAENTLAAWPIAATFFKVLVAAAIVVAVNAAAFTLATFFLC